MSLQCPSISEFLGFDGEEVRCTLDRGHEGDHLGHGKLPEGRFKQVWDTSRISAVDDSDDWSWDDDEGDA